MPDAVRRWHDRHRLWAVLAVLAALAIAFGSLTAGDEMPSRMPWDKANHFLGYGGLAGLMGLAGVRPPWAFVAATLYGIVIEYLQIPVPGRSGGDWLDILANGLGAATAALVLLGWRWARRRE
ncbi:VanZ family protein [Billgrantia saliphila]|uniref:VanZ family protein n=1 Tax=Billgrantia saliphila TaxID=1848458 RepID=UPI000CE3DCA9|nr:VanZ family protein [Halomonas saliphila]